MVGQKIKLGISACLLGQRVRFDGGHKLDPFIRDTLGKYLEFVTVCPEVECGLGVPREAMCLVKGKKSHTLQTIKTKVDLTERMLSWAKQKLVTLEKEELCGFIFKARSPSCGIGRVKVYSNSGPPSNTGIGIFARLFMERFPLIPVEEEERLYDPFLRENFIERVFTLKMWRDTKKGGLTLKKLLEFHSRYKLVILSHSGEHLRRMERLVAQANRSSIKEISKQYEKLLVKALELRATRKKHYKVMEHLIGRLKGVLTLEEKEELLELLRGYLDGYLPLLVPITLINHYATKYKDPYLQKQVYLNPDPISLNLRYHA